MRLIHATLIAAVAGVSIVAPVSASGDGRVVGTEKDEGVADQRIICRKVAEIGSLVRRKKTCFTKAEWDRLAESQQVGVKKLQDQLSSRSMGN